MKRLFPSCAATAALVSQAQDGRLSLSSRVGMWLHLASCRLCRRYHRQVRFLRTVLGQYLEQIDALPQENLSEEARNRIVQRLRESS